MVTGCVAQAVRDRARNTMKQRIMPPVKSRLLSQVPRFRINDLIRPNGEALLIRPVRPLVGYRRLSEANVDQCHLSAGDCFEAALERRADFARLFDILAVAIEHSRDRRVVWTRVDRDADKILVAHGESVWEETRHAGFLRVISVVVE